MSGFEARYFDGRSSRSRSVRVEVDGAGQVRIAGEGCDETFARDEVRVSARLGQSPRYLYLPDGARCESDDHDGVDAAFERGGGFVHALERRWSLAAAAGLLTAVFLWAGFEYALPAMARQAAHAVPVEMEAQMGRQALEALDHQLLKPTRLMEVERERARAAFARVAADLGAGGDVRLELRSAEGLGANAFALPSGIVVLTDDMVELAGADEELMAVIAHELGHVHHRHIMRSILQNSVAALLVATLLGDVTSVTGLAASIPTFLVEQRYSREFEYEADAFALAWLRTAGMDPDRLGAILTRLTRSAGDDPAGLGRYLSTHPSTAERIEAIGGARDEGR